MYKLIDYLYKLKVSKKKLIAIIFDSFLIYISIIFSLYLSRDLSFISEIEDIINLPFLIIIQIIIYIFTGQYSYFTRYFSASDFYIIAFRNIFYIFLISIFSLITLSNYSLKPFLIYFLLQTILLNYSRLLISDLFIFFKKSDKTKIFKSKVAIYGAGSAGAQLGASLRLDNKYKLQFFLDDDKNLINRKLLGKKIVAANKIKYYSHNIDKVLLAIPSLGRKRRIEIIKGLKIYIPEVLEVPSIDDLMSGRAKIDSLRAIPIEELLGRSEQGIDESFVNDQFENKVICITGAGGSIGSELCRQVLKYKLKKLIILDNSEPSLYKINEELKNVVDNKVEVIPLLCDLCDLNYLRKIFNELQINIVFHSAAYKHVPLVEQNPMSGIKNNIFSTKNICQLSYENRIEKVILISSDKAVRPSNIMGASKRLSELIFQSYADECSKEKLKTCFSMVRFGNVIGSSGSVVPLFKKQIMKGGPVTITHPDIVRYFMTIPESVKLVIFSSIMASGGEVFLLDMGKPVLIKDLAKQMILNLGFSVKDEDNNDGDIEIVYSGLRAGEKMFEELLINGDSLITEHKKIFKSIESFIPKKELLNKLESLTRYLNNCDKEEVLIILKELVPEWHQEKDNSFF